MLMKILPKLTITINSPYNCNIYNIASRVYKGELE